MTAYLKTETSKATAAFTVRLDEKTLSALDDLADKTDRSRNWLVNRAVEDYVAINAWQMAKIEKGFQAADRGDFVSEKEMSHIWKKLLTRK